MTHTDMDTVKAVMAEMVDTATVVTADMADTAMEATTTTTT